MSEAAAVRLYRALESLGASPSQPQSWLLAQRLIVHPALKPWRDDPLRLLEGSYPSLDILEDALKKKSWTGEEEGQSIGTLWGALYLPAEGLAVPVRIHAARIDGPVEVLAARPLSPELEHSARAALTVVQELLSEPPGGLCYDISAEGIDDASAAAIAGDSLGLALALAFWSAWTGTPLPETCGATGAIHGGRIGRVGWVEEKRRALARHGVALLTPEESPTLRVALETLFPPRVMACLPAELNPLVGRESERNALTELLQSGQARLLTLVGFGGAGKTRLAIEVARHAASAFPEGVWFVALEEASTKDEVRMAISRVLEVSGDALETRLKGRRLLLVLDNFETALQAAPAIGSLLRALPELHCLVTSRVALHVRGEHRFDLDGLLPDDAARLFQARTTQAGIAVTPDQRPLIEAICRRLDGLPLAIELAAARLRHLSLSELLERLEDALGLLTTRSHDVPERHRTVRATLEWSIDLLEPFVRRLLRAVSTFEGGFTAEAASALVGKEALDGMAQLEEASLLRVERERRETRFRLRVLVKELATELCEQAGESAAWKSAHDAYFIGKARKAWPIDADDIARHDALEHDIESFRSAFRRCRAASEPFPTAAVACLTRFLRRRGRWREMEEFLNHLQHRPRERVDAFHAAPLLLARAALERHGGNLVRAQRYADAARAMARRTGDPILTAELHVFHATLHARAGRAEEATREIALGLDLFERHSDPLGQIAALGNRAILLYRNKELTAAADDLTALAALAARLGSTRDEMIAHINHSNVLTQAGRWEEAEEAAWRGVAFFREHPASAAVALVNLARALLGQQRLEAARPFLHGARELHRRFPLDAPGVADLEEGLALLPTFDGAPLPVSPDELLDPDHWRRVARQHAPR